MDGVIIQQLENYTNDPLNNLDDLVNLLKQIVTNAQSNLVYREILGQSPQFWVITTKLWNWSSKKLLKEELTILPIVLELVRLFRNIVTEVPENQNQALKNKWNEITEKILWYSILKFNFDAHNKFIPILRFGSQALSNAITGNDDAQELIWSDFMNRNESNDILSTLVNCEDAVVFTSILILVYNCIHESESRSKNLFESHSGIRLLRLLLDRAETLLEDESSQNFELIYVLISRLIDLGPFTLFYDSLNQQARQVPTRHQIILLKILDSKFFSSSNSDNVSISLCTCILRIFNSIYPRVINSMQQAENSSTVLFTSSEDQLHEMEDSHLLYTGLVLLLQCIRKLSQDRNNKIRECLFKEGIIASSISLLFQADKTLPRMTKATTTPITQTSASSAFIKSDIIKIIGNMAYENITVQDEVRKLGGLPLILNQCNIDDNNPYIREYAIFAVRNLLIHNLENQKLVEQLAPIEAVQHPALQDAGIVTELGPDGKVKFSIKNARK